MNTKRGVSFDAVQKIALALPEVRQGITHGSPSFFIGKKFMGCLGDNGDILIMKSVIMERDLLVQVEPEKYFLTDHYVPFDYVLVRLPEVDEGDIDDLFRRAWRRLALKKLVAQHPDI